MKPFFNPGLSRFISIAIFAVGGMSFFGADSFKDFYYEIRARSSGQFIDYEKLGEFCGWTGQPLPGESDLEYRLRAFWNMLSAMMAMSSIALLAFGFIVGIILTVFYYTGSFDD